MLEEAAGGWALSDKAILWARHFTKSVLPWELTNASSVPTEARF